MSILDVNKIMRGFGFFFIALVLIATSIYTPGIDLFLSVLLQALAGYSVYTAINELSRRELSFPNAYKIIISVVGLLAVISLSVAVISYPTSKAVENIAESLFANTGNLGESFFDMVARWSEASFDASKLTAPAFWDNLADVIKALGDLVIQLQESGIIPTSVNDTHPHLIEPCLPDVPTVRSPTR